MNLVGPINSGPAVGGDGVATANATTSVVISGTLEAIYVKYEHSPPAATTDVVVKTAGTSPPSTTMLTLTNAATDGVFYPRTLVHDTAGATIAANYTPFLINDRVNVLIDGANALDNVDVWLLLS